MKGGGLSAIKRIGRGGWKEGRGHGARGDCGLGQERPTDWPSKRCKGSLSKKKKENAGSVIPVYQCIESGRNQEKEELMSNLVVKVVIASNVVVT